MAICYSSHGKLTNTETFKIWELKNYLGELKKSILTSIIFEYSIAHFKTYGNMSPLKTHGPTLFQE